MLLNQLVDAADVDDLFTFFITPREEGLSLQLWIAERRASRTLVEKDQVKMPELHWMAYTSNFITSDERTLLKMPADRDLAAYDTGRGYTMTVLEEAHDNVDPLALKRFRQSAISSSLGKRVLAIDKAMKAADSAKSSSSSSKKQKVDFSANQTAAEKKKTSGQNSQNSKKSVSSNEKAGQTRGTDKSNANSNFDPDSPSALPHEDGVLDASRCDNWEAGSLRRRCWDRMTASPPQCVRCGDSAHSRKSYKQPALPWEVDLDKGTPFWKPGFHRANPRQQCQLTRPLTPPIQQCALHVDCAISRCGAPASARIGLDTMSDVNACLAAVATNLRPCLPFLLDGLAGTITIDAICDVSVRRADGSLLLIQCFAAPAEYLPTTCSVIFGVPAIRELRISIGACLEQPDRVVFAPALTEPDLVAIPAPVVRPTARNPLIQAFLLVLAAWMYFAAFSSRILEDSRPDQALLPGHSGGHPLFNPEPVLVVDAVIWDSAAADPAIYDFDSCAPDLCVPPWDYAPANQTCTVLPVSAPSPAVVLRHSPGLGKIRQCHQTHRSAFVGGRGIHAYATINVPGDDLPRDISSGIDTLSDINMAARELLFNVHAISEDQVRGTAGTARFREQGCLRVLLDDTVLEMPCLVADPRGLPLRCEAVFGVPAIPDLGLDLNAQAETQNAPLQCFLGEKSLREWLDANEGASVDTKPFDLDAIEVNPDLPPEMIRRVRALLVEFAHVFDSSRGTLPKPFSTEPVRLNFCDGATPQTIPEPCWAHALSKIIEKWAHDGLCNGSLEHSKSAWASRPHVALKAPAGARAEDSRVSDCELRACGDYRLVNTQIAKLTPNLPTGTVELEKASGNNWFFESDSVALQLLHFGKGLVSRSLCCLDPDGTDATNSPAIRTK
jgi:hypothetical protein